MQLLSLGGIWLTKAWKMGSRRVVIHFTSITNDGPPRLM